MFKINPLKQPSDWGWQNFKKSIQPFRPLSEYMLQLPNTVMNINLVD
jgi:hypothetical protein